MAQSNFVSLIDQIPQVAKRDKWFISYDKSLDYLYWCKKKMYNNAKLVKVSHETSLYLNNQGKMEGLFVEYWTRNFLTHNPTVAKEVRKLLSKNVEDNIYTIGSNNKVIAEAKLCVLAESLRADVYKDAIQNEYTENELNKLMATAVLNK